MIRWLPAFFAFFAFSARLSEVYGGTLYMNNGARTLWPVTNEQVVPVDGQYPTPKILVDYYWHFTSQRIEEWEAATAAMDAISQGTKNCIGFYQKTLPQLPPSRHAIFFRPEVVSPAQPTLSCKSIANGYTPTNPVDQGQTVVLFGDRSRPGTSGCLERNPRETLRVILNALGMGNEYQRMDRGDILDVQSDVTSMIADRYAGAFDQRSTSEMAPATDFDFQSATMISEAEFAKDASRPLFNFKTSGTTVPSTAALSTEDCRTLNFAYSCGISCNPPPSGQVDDISKGMLCWRTTDALPLLSPQTATFSGKVHEFSLPGPVVGTPQVSVTPTSANLKGEIQGTSPNLKVVLSLRNKIKQRLETTVVVQVRLQNVDIIPARTVKIKVSCLPRMIFLGKEVPCTGPNSDPSGEGYGEITCIGKEDVSNVDCDRVPGTQASDDVAATADKYYIKRNYVLGKVQVIDPDCTACNDRISFSGVKTPDAPSGPAGNWKEPSTSGVIVWAKPTTTQDQNNEIAVAGSSVDFDFLYLDDTETEMVSFKVTAALKCKPSLSRSRWLRSRTSKSAFYSILSKFAR